MTIYIYIFLYIYLLVVWNIFPYIWNNHPNWFSYFSEGLKPPTSIYIWLHIWYMQWMGNQLPMPWIPWIIAVQSWQLRSARGPWMRRRCGSCWTRSAWWNSLKNHGGPRGPRRARSGGIDKKTDDSDGIFNGWYSRIDFMYWLGIWSA